MRISDWSSDVCSSDLWYRISNLDYEWWDCTYDDFSTICEILGVELKTHPIRLMGGGTRQKACIHFRGFWSPGDGASFEGRWHHAKGSVAKLNAYAPKDAQLHDIAARPEERRVGNECVSPCRTRSST